MGINYAEEWKDKLTKYDSYNVKAWIENKVVKCMSQQCIIKEDGIMIDCPRINECKDMKIIIREDNT